MRLIIIVIMMVTAILMLALYHKNGTLNTGIKKAQQPVKPNKKNEEGNYPLHWVSMRFRLF